MRNYFQQKCVQKIVVVLRPLDILRISFQTGQIKDEE